MSNNHLAALCFCVLVVVLGATLHARMPPARETTKLIGRACIFAGVFGIVYVLTFTPLLFGR